MDSIQFFRKRLILDGSAVSQRLLQMIPDGAHPQVKKGDTYYSVSITKGKRFLRFFFEFGAPKPHPDHVIDIETKEEKRNSRSEREFEPRQMFMLIDLANSDLWSSSLKRIAVVSTLMQEFGLRTELKSIYAKEDFIRKLTAVNRIRISSVPESLFGLDDLGEVISHDVYGYEADTAILEFRYKKARPLRSVLKERIETMLNRSTDFESFMISGRDEDATEVVFNNESLSERLEIDLDADDRGEHDPQAVFDSVERKIAQRYSAPTDY